MNTHLLNRNMIASAIALMLSVGAANLANAAVADLEALQGANPNLEFQYGFEGTDDGSRLADGSGNGWTLQRRTGADGGDPNAIGFVPGFEAGSQAYEPVFDAAGRRVGAGLNTISDQVPVAANITAEAVLQLDSYVPQADNEFGSYALSARPQPGNGRAYFLRQMVESGTDGRITSTFGDTFADAPAVLSYTAGDWYYLAVSASYNSGANQTTANWYLANLSAGETSLTVISNNTLFQGVYDGVSQIGIGNFVNGTQEFMDGRIETIALTNEVLSQSQLQSHLDALLSTGGVDGDFDGDNDVDGRDFVIWQSGQSDNSLSEGDLDLWQANYGAGSSALAANAAAVPEPSASLLFMLSVALASLRRRGLAI